MQEGNRCGPQVAALNDLFDKCNNKLGASTEKVCVASSNLSPAQAHVAELMMLPLMLLTVHTVAPRMVPQRACAGGGDVLPWCTNTHA